MKVRRIISAIVALAVSFFLAGCEKSNANDTNFTRKVSSKADTQSEVTLVVDSDEHENDIAEITDSEKKSLADDTNSSFSSIPSDENSAYNHDGIEQLPQSIMDTVEYYESAYPNMHIGVGFYNLDGTKGYEYSTNMSNNMTFNSACTIKAAYALYVLQTAESQGTDIWSTFITYNPARHYDNGSGVIINNVDEIGQMYDWAQSDYCIGDLVYLLLSVSDNIAFNMLEDMFPIPGFYQYIAPLGGENDCQKWGRATIWQRKNEWVAINNYINGGNLYSETLRNALSGTDYAYFVWGMTGCYSYIQKSGWTDEDFDYPAAGDCGIINDQYILIVMTEDYSFGSGHIDAIIGIGASVEEFINQNGRIIF